MTETGKETKNLKEERMKKLLVISLCLAVGVLFFAAYAGAMSTGYTGSTSATANTGINNTVHDLSRNNGFQNHGYESSQVDYLDRICIFCHAPHHAFRLVAAGANGTGPLSVSDEYSYLPLWNHTQTTVVFTPYNPGPDMPTTGSKTATSIGTAYDKIGSVSLLCLSCHDGSVAVNEYGNAPQDTRSISRGADHMDLQYKIGGDGYLANHHPIGFNYNTVQAADADIKVSSTAWSHTGDGAPGVFAAATIADTLWNGKMECSTCHAVHNKGNSGEKLLMVSDRGSNLCLTCHDKGGLRP